MNIKKFVGIGLLSSLFIGVFVLMASQNMKGAIFAFALAAVIVGIVFLSVWLIVG